MKVSSTHSSLRRGFATIRKYGLFHVKIFNGWYFFSRRFTFCRLYRTIARLLIFAGVLGGSTKIDCFGRSVTLRVHVRVRYLLVRVLRFFDVAHRGIAVRVRPLFANQCVVRTVRHLPGAFKRLYERHWSRIQITENSIAQVLQRHPSNSMSTYLSHGLCRLCNAYPWGTDEGAAPSRQLGNTLVS